MFKPRAKIPAAKKRREKIGDSDSDQPDALAPEDLGTSDVKRKRTGIDATLTKQEPSARKGTQDRESKTESEVILNSEEAIRMCTLVNESEPVAKTSRLVVAPGPSRSSANIKTTSRFDYQMDICKDYKETGYCGFGDSCIFLHDRSNYKTGWELEGEWEKLQREAIKRGPKQDDSPRPEIDESTICAFCKRVWSECETPACLTTCKHYYCEKCFLANASVRCTVCGKSTQGIFNAV